MYIEAILQANIKKEEVAKTISQINKILATDYPGVEIIQAREQEKPHKFTVIESDNDDWEEMVWKRRKL